MSILGLLTLALAILLGMEAFALLLAPRQSRKWLQRFPRDVWSGRVLSAIAIVWAAWLVYHMPLGRFAVWRPLLWPTAAVLVGFVWYYMDELLAPRALGALLLLYPAPVLASARLHPSPWSVVMSVIAYICVLKGITLLLGPYWFRLATERLFVHDTQCRMWGIVELVVSIFLFILVALVY